MFYEKLKVNQNKKIPVANICLMAFSVNRQLFLDKLRSGI